MSSSHGDHDLGPSRLEEVNDGVFAYIQPDGSWWINNTGLLVADQGAVSIDTCATERRTREFLDAVRTVTTRPVRTLVNTHHHGDHTHGNYLLPDATIVGHELTREAVIETGVPGPEGPLPYWTHFDTGALELAPPFLTFTDRVTLWSGDLRCEVRHVGTPAHTTNDSIVWIPERSTLFAGDLLFNGGTPFLLMGSLAGSLEVMEKVVAPLEATTIVPGHGPVADGSLVPQILGYLRFLERTAREGRDAGLSPLEAARQCDLGGYAEWSDQERIVGNLHRAYAELDGAERGAPIDLEAALGDMVTYNGGRRLTCLA
ncbi:cyclase [Geodermatophilus amargosae]|uniref:Cyclase n=1 Tax=Geodermatophilus amargosae TaxID=1296565 RepID=A0A1I6XZ03_9ACTN|nr:MBL fold metallo-hydrolase [Geodermatophilus amargosae]SFT43605.1 cyclase [Geodermatophilus amargosae]